MGNLASKFSSASYGDEKEVLGLEHPSKLTSMSNLAFTFWSPNLQNKVTELMSEVVQYRQEKVGPDHPDTIQSMRTSTLQKWQDETRAR